MKHAEVVIARRAVEEGRGLVVVVNKMDLLKGKQNSKMYESVINAVPGEIQCVIPQVCHYLVEQNQVILPAVGIVVRSVFMLLLECARRSSHRKYFILL